jgi:hypothetical protein
MFTPILEADFKVIIGAVAALVALFNYLPYLIGVYTKKLKPHAFSWIIWTVMTSIIFAAQLADGAGPGAWAAGVTAVTLFMIAIGSLRNKGYRVTRSDKLSFAGAVLAIPIWIITANPLWAAIIVTVIETLGFFPTYRKAFYHPEHESMLAFFLENYSVTTMLFPIALIILSLVLVLEIWWRRRVRGKFQAG